MAMNMAIQPYKQIIKNNVMRSRFSKDNICGSIYTATKHRIKEKRNVQRLLMYPKPFIKNPPKGIKYNNDAKTKKASRCHLLFLFFFTNNAAKASPATAARLTLFQVGRGKMTIKTG